MAFQNFPYTDLYTLNLDWVMRAVMDLQKAWAGFQVDWGKDIAAQVDAWLTAHPEATTTVLDGSIDTVKFVAGLRELAEIYVTPQYYGAAGDGMTDDTDAFQDAIDSGRLVIVPDRDYNLTRLLMTDDSIIIKDMGHYTGLAPVIAHNIQDSALAVVSRVRIPLDTTNSEQINGACVNSKTGKLIVCGYHDQWIYQIDPDTGTVEASANVSQIRDGNTVTYDSKRDKYFVTPCYSTGEVCELNNDLSFSRLVTLPSMSTIPYFMAYDPDRDIFYAGSSQYVYAYNGDLDTVLATFAQDPSQFQASPYTDVKQIFSQGVGVYDGQPIFTEFIQRHFGDLGYEDIYAPSIGRLVVYDWEHSRVKAFFDVSMLANEELEDIDVLEGDLVLFSSEAGYNDEGQDNHNYLVVTRLNGPKLFLTDPPEAVEPIRKEALIPETNSYVTGTQLHDYCSVTRQDDMAMLELNFYCNALPNSAGYVTIGYTPVRPIRDTQMSLIGSEGTVILLYINYDGKLYIINKVSGNAGHADHYYANIPYFAR